MGASLLEGVDDKGAQRVVGVEVGVFHWHGTMSVVVYGPQGCGKTQSAPELRQRFGSKRIVDPWDGRSPLSPGDLALTHVSPPYPRCDAVVVSWEDIAPRVGHGA
jgi:hypothetical protein